MAFGTRGSRKSDFYEFFCHWAADRSGAINATVAGCVAGLLLTLTLLAEAVLFALRAGWTTTETSVRFGVALIAAAITYGIWKRILVAPILGIFIGVRLESWLFEQREVAVAAVTFLPFICGFLTATRGIYVLNSRNR